MLHVDFGFDYFSYNKLDEPDLNLVSILNFYHFRCLKSLAQASLRCCENHVKYDKVMVIFVALIARRLYESFARKPG